MLLRRGGPGDEAEAITWLQRAAGRGHAGAMLDLGLACRDGRGVPRDLVQATRWFFAALGRGLGDGINEMQNYAREMTADQFRQADHLAGGDGSWAAAAIDAFLRPGNGAPEPKR